MSKVKIGVSDITPGKPIPWDIYDFSGKLMLARGNVLSEDKLEFLVERGAYANVGVDARRKNSEAPEQRQEIPSTLRMINAVNKRLSYLLTDLPDHDDAPHKLLEVAAGLTQAATRDPDVALATILHNQSEGIYPIRHSIDTAIVSLLVAKSFGKPEDQVIGIAAAALTMNLSMLHLQEKLQESNAPLTPEESLAIREHPRNAVETLRNAGVKDEDWLGAVLHHHENEDGSGYPLGLSGTEIPEHAKILSVSDRYCARVSNRSYRKSLLPNAALRDILLAEKNTIDPGLAASFIRELGVYPTGTFVRLENGEIGVVTGKGKSSTTPIVHALIEPRGMPMGAPLKRDTSRQHCAIRDVIPEKEAEIRFTMSQLWGPTAAL